MNKEKRNLYLQLLGFGLSLGGQLLRSQVNNNVLINSLVYIGIMLLGLGAVLTYYSKKPFIKMISQDLWKNERYPKIFIPYKTHKKKNPKIEILELLQGEYHMYDDYGITIQENNDIKIRFGSDEYDLKIIIR